LEEETVKSRGGTRKSVRIVVVDDYEPWHHVVLTTVHTEKGLQVIGKALDGLEAVQKAGDLQPDLILLDIGLPTLNGIEVARRIRKVSPSSKILFVSASRSADVVRAALSTGANGYVVKSNAASELLFAVKTVLAGKRFVSASLFGRDLVARDKEAPEARHQLKDNPYLLFAARLSIAEFLPSVIEATAADCGTLQLYDFQNSVLRIVAQHGFANEFLDYFASVGCDDECVCGVAMNRRSRVVVADVVTDPLFTNDSRDVLLRAKVRSVQATPLIDRLGSLVGMLSTHYCRPAGATPKVLDRVDELVAELFVKITREECVG
jgi:DNA-binding NarL/FixJ family response regulator